MANAKKIKTWPSFLCAVAMALVLLLAPVTALAETPREGTNLHIQNAPYDSVTVVIKGSAIPINAANFAQTKLNAAAESADVTAVYAPGSVPVSFSVRKSGSDLYIMIAGAVSSGTTDANGVPVVATDTSLGSSSSVDVYVDNADGVTYFTSFQQDTGVTEISAVASDVSVPKTADPSGSVVRLLLASVAATGLTALFVRKIIKQ